MNRIAAISEQTSMLLDREGDLELWLLGTEAVDEFNEFVLKVYNQAFTDGSYRILPEEIAGPTAEFFHRARVCGVRHSSGQLVGTWGLIVKTLGDVSFHLPIEQRYKLSLPQIVSQLDAPEIKYAFNGWRTAVDKDALEKFQIDRNKSIFVFDFLIRGLTMDLPGEPGEYLGVAEMEQLVYKYHRRVGIPWQVIGDPLFFWGRDRYPCAFKLGSFKENMHRLHPERYAFLYERPRLDA